MARKIGLPTARDLLWSLIAGALIFGIAWGSIVLTRGDGYIAKVWLANAVVVALLLRSPRRRRPTLVAISFAVFLGSHLASGDAFGQSIALAVAKLAEVLIVAIPLHRMFGEDIDLGKVRPLGAFLVLAGFVAPVVTAIGATAYFTLADGADAGPLFEQWAVSHALGFLTVTPLVMAIPSRISGPVLRPRLLVESALTIAVIAGVAWLVYTQSAPLQPIIIPFLVFAAFRLPTLAAALAIAVVAAEAVILTSLGLGPIAASQFDPAVQLMVLQAFIACAVLVTLPVSVVIGERNRLHEAEIDARAAAESATRAKSAFLATMSHEIRTPMTGVLGMIELLRAEPEDAERERYFAILKQSATLLMTVLDDVLDYSKIESGNLVLENVGFEPEEVAGSAITLFSNAASQKGLLLSMHCDCPPGAIVTGDPIRLQQVLSNLIGNAIKFTERGRVTLNVRICDTGEGGRTWRFEVRDTGIGIARDHIETLFQPFVQAEMSTSRRFGGTGLGLSISRWLVEAMGGRMGFDSRVRRGSTFWFEVPLPAAIASEWRAPAATIPPVCRVLDVLVAEDNPVNQMLIEAIVRRFGHDVTLVDNGRLAVDAAAKRSFDCILMDMQMPGMDGLAATREIRASGGPCAQTPIIALTADASPERRRFYDNVGLTDFLTKPIDPLALATRLAAVAEPPQPDDDAGDLPVFDTAKINQLCATIGSTKFDGLLDLLAVELNERPADIRRAVAAGDVDLARRQAHSLKGATTSVGAMALGQAAAAIEQAPDLESMAAGLKHLDRQTARTRRAVEALLPGSPRKRVAG